MKLTDLDTEFVTTARAMSKGSFRRVEKIEEAQGVMHACPRCFVDKGGTMIGVHRCIEWSRERGADPEQSPLPGRWRLVGTGLHDLTLDAEPPETRRSVREGPPCNGHFNVTNGEVTFC